MNKKGLFFAALAVQFIAAVLIIFIPDISLKRKLAGAEPFEYQVTGFEIYSTSYEYDTQTEKTDNSYSYSIYYNADSGSPGMVFSHLSSSEISEDYLNFINIDTYNNGFYNCWGQVSFCSDKSDLEELWASENWATPFNGVYHVEGFDDFTLTVRGKISSTAITFDGLFANGIPVEEFFG